MDYKLTLKWNKPAQCWIADIADGAGNAIVTGIAVVTGADLLEQFGYLRMGGQLLAQSTMNVDDVPTFTNLGTSSKVYFLSP